MFDHLRAPPQASFHVRLAGRQLLAAGAKAVVHIARIDAAI